MMCMRQLHASRSRGLATVFFTVSASAARTEIPCLEAWCCSRCQLSRQCNMINNGKPKNRLAIVLRRLHWRLVHRWLSLHFLSFFFSFAKGGAWYASVTASGGDGCADDCSGRLQRTAALRIGATRVRYSRFCSRWRSVATSLVPAATRYRNCHPRQTCC